MPPPARLPHATPCGFAGALRHHDIVPFPVHQQNRRAVRQFRLHRVGGIQRTGKRQNCPRRARPAHAGKQQDHRTLAEPHNRVRVGRQFQPGKSASMIPCRYSAAVRIPASTRGGEQSSTLRHCDPNRNREGSAHRPRRTTYRDRRAAARVPARLGHDCRHLTRGAIPPIAWVSPSSPAQRRASKPSISCLPDGCSALVRTLSTGFARSPTGYLHLGHAFSAFNAWGRAGDSGGRLLLRLEDIDPGRCRPEFAAVIHEDVTWLGLHWDG